MDRVLNRLRAFSLPDGGGEPATRFAPLAVESNAVPPIVTGVKTNDE
jgi:hypothetical protein